MSIIAFSAACAQVPPADAETPLKGGGTCDAAKARKLIGRTASRSVDAEALRLTGARTLRRVPKDGVITMDYREDRLNLWLDGAKRIKRITCG